MAHPPPPPPLDALLPHFLQHEVAEFDRHVASGTLSHEAAARFVEIGPFVARVEQQSIAALDVIVKARHLHRLETIAAFRENSDIGRTMRSLDNLTEALQRLMQTHSELRELDEARVELGIVPSVEGDDDDGDSVEALNDAEMGALSLTTVEPGVEHDDANCSVCTQSLFREGNVLRTLHCNHQFHQHCIDEWLRNRSVRCPLCRRDQRHRLV